MLDSHIKHVVMIIKLKLIPIFNLQGKLYKIFTWDNPF